jgi:histone H3/H4
LSKNRAFSLYDIEEFLKEAGAEHINERAVESLEKELESTVNELIGDARLYANYAGRTRLITNSDISLAKRGRPGSGVLARARASRRALTTKQRLDRKLLSMRASKRRTD